MGTRFPQPKAHMAPLRTQLALIASPPGLLEDLRDIWSLAAQRALSKAGLGKGTDSAWGWDLQQSCLTPGQPPVPSGPRQGRVPGSQVLQWAGNTPRAKEGGNQMVKAPQAHPGVSAGALLSTARNCPERQSLSIITSYLMECSLKKQINNTCWEMQGTVWTRVWSLREFPAALGALHPAPADSREQQNCNSVCFRFLFEKGQGMR